MAKEIIKTFFYPSAHIFALIHLPFIFQQFAFMRRFGYLDANPTDSEALYSEDAVIDAIKLVQKYGGIPQTGAVDDETLKVYKQKFLLFFFHQDILPPPPYTQMNFSF